MHRACDVLEAEAGRRLIIWSLRPEKSSVVSGVCCLSAEDSGEVEKGAVRSSQHRGPDRKKSTAEGESQE